MSNPGEIDLFKLLRDMQPTLHEGTYVFVSVPSLEAIPPETVISHFREKEGISVILEKRDADQLSLNYEFTASWITLEVHSSLSAVGLTAAFASALAENNISCNVVAGYYHDHLFVPKISEKKAMDILTSMRAGS